jgi:hypothetical protein
MLAISQRILTQRSPEQRVKIQPTFGRPWTAFLTVTRRKRFPEYSKIVNHREPLGTAETAKKKTFFKLAQGASFSQALAKPSLESSSAVISRPMSPGTRERELPKFPEDTFNLAEAP